MRSLISCGWFIQSLYFEMSTLYARRRGISLACIHIPCVVFGCEKEAEMLGHVHAIPCVVRSITCTQHSTHVFHSDAELGPQFPAITRTIPVLNKPMRTPALLYAETWARNWIKGGCSLNFKCTVECKLLLCQYKKQLRAAVVSRLHIGSLGNRYRVLLHRSLAEPNKYQHLLFKCQDTLNQALSRPAKTVHISPIAIMWENKVNIATPQQVRFKPFQWPASPGKMLQSRGICNRLRFGSTRTKSRGEKQVDLALPLLEQERATKRQTLAN
jgi:hypothetical protein